MSEVSSILDEREGTHGDFREVARVAQGLKAVMETGKNWDCIADFQRETLDMIQSKVARILSGDPDCLDHLLDIAGYATLAARIMKGRSHG